MEKSRIAKSKKNIIVGLIYQISTIFTNFFTRTIFIKILSSEYLGINGLFSNILSVLSLAELGIGNAIVYSMYKPLKENDYDKLTRINYFYKKVYSTIGIIVFLLGILVVPFLKYIINLGDEIQNIVLYYILFLLNTVSSYFFIYKTSIVTADQNDYIIKIVNIASNITKLIVQLIALVIFKSYLVYLLVQLIISVITNFINSQIAEKKYPYIKDKKILEKEEKKSILNNVKSLFLYQLGGVILNNTDNIIISIICGTIVVGVYSNYSMIISAIETTIAMIFTAMLSSIGNYNVDKDSEEQYKLFKVLNMIAFWIYGFASVCFLGVFQDFIQMWAGESYLLEYIVVIVSVINFYIRGLLYPIWCFRNTTTLFKKTKNIMIIASILNIALSIVLGKICGIFGILLATAISRILTNLWYEPKILYKEFFKKNIKKYFIRILFEILLLTVICIIVLKILEFVKFSNLFIQLFVKLIICIIIPNIVMLIRYYNTDEFKYCISKILNNKLYNKCIKQQNP